MKNNHLHVKHEESGLKMLLSESKSAITPYRHQGCEERDNTGGHSGERRNL